MSNILNELFSKIFVINVLRRTDRWAHFQEQMVKMGNPVIERFDAHCDVTDENGTVSGNNGCTASHRALLEIIAYHKWSRVLIFEDDAMLRPEFENNFEDVLNHAMAEMPESFNMLYLGGGYGEAAKRRVSKHVIETNSVMTTSSYAVTWQSARRMAPYISGGPIDSLYHRFNREPGCYMIQPRLFVQYSSFSDLTERESSNEMSMTDSAHEDMLLEGVWVNGSMLDSTLNRRELAAPNDMDGTGVIVEGKRFRVVAVGLPEHPAPWFRGEKVTYQLQPV